MAVGVVKRQSVPYTSNEFDRFVEVAIASWEQLAEVARAWPQMDGEEQTVFSTDWPSVQVILRRLEAYAAEQPLTPLQQSRYEYLQRTMEENRPLLLRLGIHYGAGVR